MKKEEADSGLLQKSEHETEYLLQESASKSL